MPREATAPPAGGESAPADELTTEPVQYKPPAPSEEDMLSRPGNRSSGVAWEDICVVIISYEKRHRQLAHARDTWLNGVKHFFYSNKATKSVPTVAFENHPGKAHSHWTGNNAGDYRWCVCVCPCGTQVLSQKLTGGAPGPGRQVGRCPPKTAHFVPQNSLFWPQKAPKPTQNGQTKANGSNTPRAPRSPRDQELFVAL